jgi:hypothetical protein
MRPPLHDDPDSWISVDRDPLRTLKVVIAAIVTAFCLGVGCGYWLHLCAC